MSTQRLPFTLISTRLPFMPVFTIFHSIRYHQNTSDCGLYNSITFKTPHKTLTSWRQSFRLFTPSVSPEAGIQQGGNYANTTTFHASLCSTASSFCVIASSSPWAVHLSLVGLNHHLLWSFWFSNFLSSQTFITENCTEILLIIDFLFLLRGLDWRANFIIAICGVRSVGL